MAVRNSDGSIILTTSIDQTGIKNGMKSMTSIVKKSFAVIGVAAATATVAITKMAVSAYADYEQLVGGVETMFKNSAKKVMKYANEAFYTAGVSANEYMRQVTSFSASLIRSVQGDTEKAADIANMALIDISDNVNKMGSTMESVTLAYQGFAKQQYMLLDNLKLGYGGTKTEMQRLLKDAQKITGVKYDINNLADVYTAIHVIQVELGIAGTTAEEAANTISGSAKMMKAAWQNVLTAIAGGGDLDKAIENLVFSIEKFFENIVPVIEKSLRGIGRLIEKIAPMLVQRIAKLLIESIPDIINAIFQMIVGLAKGIWEGVKSLFSGGSKSITSTVESSIGGVSDATDNATDSMENLGDATEEAGEKAKKSLASFDELNILQTDDNEDLSSSLAGNVLSVPITSEIVTSGEGTSDNVFGFILDGIKERLTEIGGLIKDGFWDGFQEHDFSKLQEDLKVIEETTAEIFSDSQLQNSANNFANKMAYAFGQIGGAFASIGASIVENLTGGIRYFLEENSDSIKEDLTSIFDASGEATETLGNFASAVANIFSSIGSTAGKKFTGSLMGLLYEIFAGIGVLGSNVGKDILNAILNPIINNQDSFRVAFENLFSVLAPIIDGAKGVVGGLFDGITELWNRGLSPALAMVSNSFSTVFGGILNAWNNNVAPSLSSAFGKIGDSLKNAFGPAISNLLSSIGNLVGSIVRVFSPLVDAISSIFGKIIEIVGSILSPIINIVGGVVSGIIELFSGIIDGVAKVFNGIADAITKLFEGDIWGAIDSIIGGIFDGIVEVVQGVWGFIEEVAAAIKDFFDAIFGWIGDLFSSTEEAATKTSTQKHTGSGRSVNPSTNYTVPKLATGAVIPPNKEFLAILGDQKSGTNIEAPLDTIKQAIRDELSNSDRVQPETVTNINFTGSLAQLARVLKPQIERETLRQGNKMTTGGAY